MRRQILIATAVLAALLLGAQAALAGGWVLITFDELPAQARAGESFQLGFTVRQHGQTLINNDWDGNPLKPVVSAKLAGMQQPLTFVARQAGSTGHFVAEVVLPEAGEWEWSIAVPPFAMPSNGQFAEATHFAPLQVLPAAAQAKPAEAPAQPGPVAPPASAPLTPSMAWLPWAGGALLALALVALLLMQRGRSAARGHAG